MTGASGATATTSSSPAPEGLSPGVRRGAPLSTDSPGWLRAPNPPGTVGSMPGHRTAVLLATGVVATGIRAVGDLVLPVRCGGCDRPGTAWCPTCSNVVTAAPAPRRWWPTPAPAGLPPVWTVLAYEGPVRAALVSWKDHGRRDLARVLVPPLTEGLLTALVARPRMLPCVVVPAPSGRSNVRRRGDQPLRLLIRRALAALPPEDRPPVVPALRLARPVADQAGLDSRARTRNLTGAMRVRPTAAPRVRGACCVLVDDVITTGATLAEATRALHAEGAATVLAVTVAATGRHTATRRSGTVG